MLNGVENGRPAPAPGAAPARTIGWPLAGNPGPDGITADTVRRICDLRRKRDDVFARKLFRDPTWEIMLRLYIAHLEGNRMSITRLTRSSRVALTTVLRKIAILETDGLVRRSEDPLDGRRVYVSLSFAGGEAMDRCFAASGNRAQFI